MGETLTVKRCAWALSSQQYLDYHHLWLNRRSQSIHRAWISFAFQRHNVLFAVEANFEQRLRSLGFPVRVLTEDRTDVPTRTV
jgi:hypothetical protein